MKNYVFKRILLTTSVACCALVVSGNVNAATMSTWEEFKAAIAAGESEIVLADNLTATDIITITSPVNIKSSDGQIYKISAAEGLKFSDSFIKYTGTSSSPLLNLSNVQISNIYHFNNTNAGTYAGGIISNQGTISEIDANFIGNTMSTEDYRDNYTYGGIIQSSGKIGTIKGLFKDNTLKYYNYTGYWNEQISRTY